MLAASADAFLRCRRAAVWTLVETEEDILELVHPGIGKQQGRVFVRYQRAGRNDLVALGSEVVEELLADFGAFHKLAAFKALIFEASDFNSKLMPVKQQSASPNKKPARRRVFGIRRCA
jgi:hypothetical protein